MQALPSLLTFDAFFFDFDGLLVDTEPLHYLAYQKMLAKRNLVLPWDFATYCSYAHQKTAIFAEAIFTLFPALREENPNWMELREEKVAIYQKLLLTQPVALMPGVEEMLHFLARHHKSIYVVTNATRDQLEAIQPQHKVFRAITAWVSREDYEHPKPAPDSYLKAMELYSKKPFKGIGFEDAVRGIQALKAASLTPVWILPSGYARPATKELEGVYVFSSFHELLNRD
ncbi:MAG: HAD family phosphatase [Chlamydiae bacterium]|nr:HAD family phosphatase [Chlamydiota bacterium]